MTNLKKGDLVRYHGTPIPGVNRLKEINKGDFGIFIESLPRSEKVLDNRQVAYIFLLKEGCASLFYTTSWRKAK